MKLWESTSYQEIIDIYLFINRSLPKTYPAQEEQNQPCQPLGQSWLPIPSCLVFHSKFLSCRISQKNHLQLDSQGQVHPCWYFDANLNFIGLISTDLECHSPKWCSAEKRPYDSFGEKLCLLGFGFLWLVIFWFLPCPKLCTLNEFSRWTLYFTS